MNSIADAIQKFFAGADSALTPFLAALTVIGVATMAIIQTIKDTTPFRRKFQAAALDAWLREGADEANAAFGDALRRLGLSQVNPATAREQLVRLSVDGEEKALFSLSVEQMCGQMNSAVQVALDYPTKYAHLLFVAASGADAEDAKALADTAVTGASSMDDASRIALADARNRVVHQLQRAIDGFQIKTSFRWKWWLQFASFALSVVLSWIALLPWQGAEGFTKIVAVLLTAAAAGFLAPVARDLTAALQKMRG
ncbi:MAG: hypothetical protein FJ363_03375 [Gemmatimonadetes bacterium]|nr:hypothetical protein [Gemmatimonadota bacterium]